MSISLRKAALAASIALAALTATANAVSSHEFWIEPLAFAVNPGERIVADLKVGLNFRGGTFPYLRNRFVQMSVSARSHRYDVKRDEGDSPAVVIPKSEAGLNVITYHSTADKLTYEDWAPFVSYADEESLTGVLDAHAQRGLPQTGFTELYTRCAKALVQSGAVTEADHDSASGMPLELVAVENPYASANNSEIDVLLIWQTLPKARSQVTLFRDDGHVTKQKLETDDQGRLKVPLSGGGRFMLSAVQMVPTNEKGAVWQSYWASLTFAVPIRSHDALR